MTIIDGDMPLTAMYSSASVHDSSLVLPMINETSSKVNYLYDLQDAAYDSNVIKIFSVNNGHRPIIDINPKNSKALKAQITLAKSEKEILKSFNLYNNSNGYDKIYYRGAIIKVASVLSFGVLSICIHQSLKLVI
ncbi:hypothetical protein [Sulfurovum sp. NBC37-1]|uniref:hypothetical protein n=1 Tax=Sulfurovum sp. (strain NBC37-1) TaxID=387093 RepID=UPI0005A01AB8|nr:hypothetical protein [Sulfurovum sp. NBC37-1]